MSPAVVESAGCGRGGGSGIAPGAARVLLGAVSLSWATIYDFVPAGDRPYVGSTTRNSMLELALVHNGLVSTVYR
jgi:hypothetical protein